MSTGGMHKRSEPARIRALLERSIHFRDLAPQDLDSLAAMGRVRDLRNGEILAAAARPQNCLFIVMSGCLRVSSVDAQGREFVYAMLGPGSFYGLGSVLHAGAPEVDAHAAGASAIAMLDGPALIALLNGRPHLWRHMTALLYRRLTLAMLTLRDISVAPLPQRITRRLLGQAISCGNDISGESAVELRVTQSDLGHMLGTSRSRVNTALKRMEKDGLLKVGYRTVKLVNIARLRQAAGPDIFAF
jgi:CRP/FNR family cyclic AMP-dependent transcriptional regulator